ncbi:MAG: leucine-rich repeat domain-containing protein [Clostridia bacterium]|nr:leucine-rich repeat domain-containing protein [Clostridia bacterium]
MKKRILMLTLMLALFVCLFAISVSAETALKPQDNNAYGELSFFDESISVGRTNTKYGFTPYIDAEGTTYARVVVGDGTTFYTFPTAYILSEGTIYGEGQINNYCQEIKSLNAAMETATGTNPNWTVDNIYRIELPYSVTRLNGSSDQAFQGYDNVIEIRLQPNSHVKDQNKSLIFWKCFNLETIHNLDTFTFRNGCLSGSFQECRSLKSLTIGYSPEVTTLGTNTFNGCTNLESVNLSEAFPNLQTIGQDAFNSAGIKYISIPAAVTSIGVKAFYNCTNLQFVDFNDNPNTINESLDAWGMFQNCSSLCAVSFPDNFKYIPNRMFAGCTSLKAVHLPSNLERMDTNNWGEDPFNGCQYLYFVNDDFEVVDENGNFYTSETFVQPTKPDVYYMPNTLSALCTNKTSGKCFTGCYNMNPVVVFGTNMVKTTVGDGIFFECGSNGTLGSGITVVFLGDMQQICINTNGNRAKGVKYIFANANDKSLADVNIINNTTSGYNLNDKTEGFYFCNGNCHYLLYNSATGKNVQYNGTYSDSVLTKITGTTHSADVKNSEITPATCIKNAYGTLKCFCGYEMGTQEIANTATGIHIFADDHDCTTSDKCTADPDCTEVTVILSHELYETLVYESFLAGGKYNYGCSNDGCTVIDIVDEDAKAIFTAGEDKGYSASESGTGIAFGGYTINIDALNEYNRVNENNKLNFGIIIVNPNYVGDTFMKDGKANAEKGFLQVDMSDAEYSNIQIMVNGFTGNAANLSLVFTLYAYTDVNDVEFIQSEDTLSASAKVTKTDATLYTVTLDSVKAQAGTAIPELPEYVVPSKEQE